MALHFGGRYRDINYGVPAFELARDQRVVDAGVTFASPAPAAVDPNGKIGGRKLASQRAIRSPAAAHQPRRHRRGARRLARRPRARGRTVRFTSSCRCT